MPLTERAQAVLRNAEAGPSRWPDGTINHTKESILQWLIGLADRFRERPSPIVTGDGASGDRGMVPAPSRAGPEADHDSIRTKVRELLVRSLAIDGQDSWGPSERRRDHHG